MAKSIGMTQAKSKLAELVGRVAYGGERFVLERRGQPMAVLINVDEHRRLRNLEWEARGRPLPPELLQRQEQFSNSRSSIIVTWYSFVVATSVAGYAARTTKVVTTNSITGIAAHVSEL